MPGSRFAEAASAVRARADLVGLPLPRREDWDAAGGWVALGVVLLAAGVAATVLSVWSRLVPATRPLPDRLLPLAVVLALADCAVAGAATLRPTSRVAVWRLLTVAAAVLGAVWTDPVGVHARLWLPWIMVTWLLGWIMRAAETLAAANAGVRLHTRRAGDRSSPTDPAATPADLDPSTRRNPVSTTWRVVAEGWLLAAACAAIGGAGPGFRGAVACAACGGAVLVLGAQGAMLRASWQGRRFTVDPGQIRAHWSQGLAMAVALLVLALTVPLPGGVRLVLPWLGHFPGSASPSLGGGNLTGGGLPPVPRIVVKRPLIALCVAAGVLAVLALSRPARTWALLRRLVAPLLALWRYLWRTTRGAVLRGPGIRPAGTDEAISVHAHYLDRPWPPGDLRAAVRAAYRRFLADMAAAGAVRPPHVSPRAYVQDMMTAPAEVDDLTTVYELARYSDHTPEPRWVELARRGLAAIARTIVRRP